MLLSEDFRVHSGPGRGAVLLVELGAPNRSLEVDQIALRLEAVLCTLCAPILKSAKTSVSARSRTILDRYPRARAILI